MVSQAVVRTGGDATPAVHIDPVGQHPHETNSAVHELNFGSQDLIRLAEYSTRREFDVSEFHVSDSYLTPLPEAQQRSTSSEMVDTLTRFGSRELVAAMRDEFSGLYVTGVTLISRRSGMRVIVRRRGIVDTAVIPDAEALLNAAWRDLHLA